MTAHDAAYFREYRARRRGAAARPSTPAAVPSQDPGPCPRCASLAEEVAHLKALLASRAGPVDPFAGLAQQDRDYMERKLARKAPPVPRM
jgi:hypothetical protein